MVEEKEEQRSEGKEKNISTAYYEAIPEFGKKGPSKLRTHFNRGLTSFLVVASCVVFYFALLRLSVISEFLHNILGILQPIIFGLGLAYLLNPLVKKIEAFLTPFFARKIKNEEKAENIARGIGVGVSIAFLIAIIVTLCNMMLPELFQSIRDMIFTVPSQLNDMVGQINEMYSADSTVGRIVKNLLQQGTDYFQTWLQTDLLKQTNVLMTNLTAGVINIVSVLFNMVIGLIIAIYVLFGKSTLTSQSKKIVYALFQPSKANMILHITMKSNEIFGGFIIGKIIDSLIIGILCFFGMSLLKMPYVMLVSVIIGVTNVIPFFGPYIGAIPSALLILLDDPRKGIYFIIFILVLQQIDGNIIGPKILGNSTGLSAFWVVFAILVGGGLFGVPGMILGVPTFGVIFYITKMLLEHQLQKKNLPTDTEYYSQQNYVDSEGDFIHKEEVGESCVSAYRSKQQEKPQDVKKETKSVDSECRNEQERTDKEKRED
ncbi:MAG: AI-2E family transporter [Hespellia sp.]|nr:AI-2E family transporter [Hespellia sp.]